MEVSKTKVESSGQELVETLVSLTGLPEPWIQQELHQIIDISGQSAEGLTLEQLREAMLVYLEAVNSEISSGEA